MTHIAVWIYPQCMASPVTAPLDVFAIANAIWMAQGQAKEQRQPLFSWSIHSADGAPVTTPTGVVLQVNGDFASDVQADVLMLPGIFLGNGMQDLWRTLDDLRPYFALLRAKHAQGSLLVSNCSASFVLAEAGLLEHGHATTAWWLERVFKARYPQIELRLGEVLDEYRGIVTSGAASSYMNLALDMVRRFAGPELAASVAKTMLIDANRATQTPYMNLSGMTQQESQSHADGLVMRAQKWLRQHRHVSFRLAALADYLAVSERTVIRHFHQALGTTPASYAQLLKIDLAKRLMETTTLTLEQVAERTGYADPSSFRRLFKRHTSLSPVAYRAQFKPQKSVAAAAATTTAAAT
ncbi:helix-turn-helix domain-containing protein [Undibacterium sp. Jales W-56]|uniref:GlxA family transcriptional regulator n=1 Tax=Undibacterium sp. Jales W-56 TaxID=2897325 RepID=UPI0021D2588E|nr:helix-turn-helix domain-containing protein [Undibacterium sp. Jales W-56]MCU6434270.1 helix-turn-helix domain-containing protein [Undibacterium sp. Jales W-56]